MNKELLQEFKRSGGNLGLLAIAYENLQAEKDKLFKEHVKMCSEMSSLMASINAKRQKSLIPDLEKYSENLTNKK